jgi:hypothetical protein
LAVVLNSGGDALMLINTWLQALQHQSKGRSEFRGQNKEEKVAQVELTEKGRLWWRFGQIRRGR